MWGGPTFSFSYKDHIKKLWRKKKFFLPKNCCFFGKCKIVYGLFNDPSGGLECAKGKCNDSYIYTIRLAYKCKKPYKSKKFFFPLGGISRSQIGLRPIWDKHILQHHQDFLAHRHHHQCLPQRLLRQYCIRQLSKPQKYESDFVFWTLRFTSFFCSSDPASHIQLEIIFNLPRREYRN